MGDLVVGIWSDPSTERDGHPVTGTWVEHQWLPVIGPTSLLLARRLVEIAETDGWARRDDLAWALGVAHSTAKHGPLNRSLARLSQFGVARVSGDRVAVRSHLGAPPPTLRFTARSGSSITV